MIIYDLIYYIPVLIYIDLIETNSTNYNSTIIISKTCSYRKAEQLMIVSVMDTINRVLPFSLKGIDSHIVYINNEPLVFL